MLLNQILEFIINVNCYLDYRHIMKLYKKNQGQLNFNLATSNITWGHILHMISTSLDMVML